MTPAFTILCAVDNAHLAELQVSYPTWLRHHPDFSERPMVVLCDPTTKFKPLSELLKPQKHCDIVVFDLPAAESQREKMLSSFVLVGPENVETPYYLKLDTDCIATAGGDWIDPAWFDGEPAFIAPPWGYTKPASMFFTMEKWCEGVPSLACNPPLDRVIGSFDSNIVRHSRMISYCMFGNTQWTREAAALCNDNRLPVPSQDTFLYHVAARQRKLWRAVRMPGWRHVGGGGWRLQQAAREAMGEASGEGGV